MATAKTTVPLKNPVEANGVLPLPHGQECEQQREKHIGWQLEGLDPVSLRQFEQFLRRQSRHHRRHQGQDRGWGSQH